MKLLFGNVGVCVGGYTKESLYAILTEHNLETLMDDRYVSDSSLIDKHMYLQFATELFLGKYELENFQDSLDFLLPI